MRNRLYNGEGLQTCGAYGWRPAMLNDEYSGRGILVTLNPNLILGRNVGGRVASLFAHGRRKDESINFVFSCSRPKRQRSPCRPIRRMNRVPS